MWAGGEGLVPGLRDPLLAARDDRASGPVPCSRLRASPLREATRMCVSLTARSVALEAVLVVVVAVGVEIASVFD